MLILKFFSPFNSSFIGSYLGICLEAEKLLDNEKKTYILIAELPIFFVLEKRVYIGWVLFLIFAKHKYKI